MAEAKKYGIVKTWNNSKVEQQNTRMNSKNAHVYTTQAMPLY